TAPTQKSFAASGTVSNSTRATGLRSWNEVGAVRVVAAATGSATAAVGVKARGAVALNGPDSSESANPTGTMSAAATAARTRTRYRFRICPVLSRPTYIPVVAAGPSGR